MQRWILGLAVAVLASGVAVADDKAVSVVKKGIEAHGGADAINKYKAGKGKLKGEINILNMSVEFTGSMSYALPDKYRMDLELSVAGQAIKIHQTVRGDKIKSTVNVAGMEMADPNAESQKESLKTSALTQEMERLTPLLADKKYTLKFDKEEEVKGSKASIIEVSVKGFDKKFKMAFDQKSGMLVRIGYDGQGPGADGQPAKVYEEHYSLDYKKINGVMVATKGEVHHDGSKFMSFEMSDLELLEKIDDKEFSIDD